jgi:hypothetical protein
MIIRKKKYCCGSEGDIEGVMMNERSGEYIVDEKERREEKLKKDFVSQS